MGKTLALDKALQLARRCAIDGFYADAGGFTCGGMREAWRAQQRSARGAAIEGLHIEGECSMILKERTGNETVSRWIIRVLEHGEFTEKTVGHGVVRLRDLTIAFGFGSTVQYLRTSISVGDFAGGFMHRFLIAHESEQRDPESQAIPTDAELEGLATGLRHLRAQAPPILSVTAAAESRLSQLRNQARRRNFDSVHLAGYWNRFPVAVAKLAGVLALSDEAWTIDVGEIDRAAALLSAKLYPVLAPLIEDIAATEGKKALLELADSLAAAGPDGWTTQELMRRMPATGQRAQDDMLSAMRSQGLLWQRGSRVFGREEWAQ